MTAITHQQRIHDELEKAGTSSYGAHKFSSRYLPQVIHEDEHIKAAVYGRYKVDGGLLSYSAGMLVATDKRVIFIDHKPGFTTTDELTYDVVSGVKKTTSGISSTLVLHTRIGDYIIRFANEKGADKFVRYIETRRLETQARPMTPAAPVSVQSTSGAQKQALDFLKTHDTGVVSTVDRYGIVHGAAVYYCIDDAARIYVVTKASTQKARDVFTHQQVAFTVFEAAKEQTVQVNGVANIVTDATKKASILKTLTAPRQYDDGKRLPAVTTIHEDAFVVLQISIDSAHYTDYSQRQ